MDMTGRFAKDLRGFQNLAGLTSQNHCGEVLVPYRNDSGRREIAGAVLCDCPVRAGTCPPDPDMSHPGEGGHTGLPLPVRITDMRYSVRYS